MARDVTIKIGAKDAASSVLARLTGNLKKFSRVSPALAAGITAAGAAATAATLSVARAVVQMSGDFAKAGDELHKMSLRTGVAVESLSQLKFAAEQSGSSLAGIEKGIRGMQRALLSAELGSSEMVDALQMIGVEMDQLRGMNPEDQFTILIDKLSEVEGESQRAALAMRVFGRAGTELLPLMADGAKGVAELREELIALGGEMTGEQAQAAADYTDAMNRLTTSATGLRNELASQLLPTLTETADVMTDLTRVIRPLLAFTTATAKSTLELSSAYRKLSFAIGSVLKISDFLDGIFGSEEVVKKAVSEGEKVGGDIARGIVRGYTDTLRFEANRQRELDAFKALFGRPVREFKQDLRFQNNREKGIEEFKKMFGPPERQFKQMPEEGIGTPLQNRIAPPVQATQGRLLSRGPGASQAAAQGKKLLAEVGRIENILAGGGQPVPVKVEGVEPKGEGVMFEWVK